MASEGFKRHRSILLDLPPEVVMLIIPRLENNDIVRLSQVSKSFLSLTSGFLKHLNLGCVLPRYSLRKLFARLTSVNRITLYSKTSAIFLKAIANSGLKIEFLKISGGAKFPKIDKFIPLSGKFPTVKSLTLSLIDWVPEQQIVGFIHLFPSLEELHTHNHAALYDFGIEKLVRKPLNLRKVSLSFSSCLTDQSLDMLTNCGNLEYFSLTSSGSITIEAFCSFLRSKKKILNFLELPKNCFPLAMPYDFLQLAETISLIENLSHLKISPCFVRDDFLRIIANSRLRLTSLEFIRERDQPIGYTMTGMSAMLLAFKGLTKIRLYTPWPVLDTADTEMSQLMKSLPCLTDVYLITQFTAYKTMFSLIHNCPSLKLICVQFIRCTTNKFEVPQEIKKNYSVQRFTICPEPVTALKIALKLACPSCKLFSFYPFDVTC